MASIDALASIGDKKSSNVLKKLAKDKDSRIAASAADALERIKQ